MNIYLGKNGSLQINPVRLTGYRQRSIIDWLRWPCNTLTVSCCTGKQPALSYENPWASVPVFKGLEGLKWSLVWQTKPSAGAVSLVLSGFSTTGQHWALLFCTLFGQLLVNWGKFWGDPHQWVEADLLALMWGTQGEWQEGKGQLGNELM